MRHQRRCGFVIHIPETQQKGPSAGIQESAHKAEQVVAARDLAHTGLAPAEGHEVGLTRDGKQIKSGDGPIRQLEAREHRIILAESRVSGDVKKRRRFAVFDECSTGGVCVAEHSCIRDKPV